MGKRLIDGDLIAGSDSLAECSLSTYQLYWVLATLALANASFECAPKTIIARRFQRRPEMTADQVEQALIELEGRKRLFRWKEPDGKEWGHLVGGHRFMPDFSQLNDPRRPNGTHHALGAWIPLRRLARFSGQSYGELLEEFAKRLGGPYIKELSVFKAIRGSHLATTRRRRRGNQVAEGLDLTGKETIGFRSEPISGVNSVLPASPASPPTAAPPLTQEERKGAALESAPARNSFFSPPPRPVLTQDVGSENLLFRKSAEFQGIRLFLTAVEVSELADEFDLPEPRILRLLLDADAAADASAQRIPNAFTFARGWLRQGGGRQISGGGPR